MAKKRLSVLLGLAGFFLASPLWAVTTAPVAVRILSPAAGEVVTNNSVDVFVALDHGRGDHLHLILNNEPPRDISDPHMPVTFKNLPEGGQTLRLLAVRPDGRAHANPEAFAMVRFFVGRRDFQNQIDPATPFLTVNLPLAGIDGGIDRRVDFDFLLANAVLAKEGGFVVRCSLNQQQQILTENKPLSWDHLDPGRYQLIAELLSSDLQPVPGLFNRVVRTVEVPVMAKAVPVQQVPVASHRRPED